MDDFKQYLQNIFENYNDDLVIIVLSFLDDDYMQALYDCDLIDNIQIQRSAVPQTFIIDAPDIWVAKILFANRFGIKSNSYDVRFKLYSFSQLATASLDGEAVVKLLKGRSLILHTNIKNSLSLQKLVENFSLIELHVHTRHIMHLTILYSTVFCRAKQPTNKRKILTTDLYIHSDAVAVIDPVTFDPHYFLLQKVYDDEDARVLYRARCGHRIHAVSEIGGALDNHPWLSIFVGKCYSNDDFFYFGMDGSSGDST